MTENLAAEDISFDSQISKNEFGIRIEMYNRKYTNHDVRIFNSAYAYRCFTEYSKDDSIIDITITTLNPFDSLHGELSEVSDFFVGDSNSLFLSKDSLSLDSLVEAINQDNYEALENIDLFLINQDIIDTTHQFVIEIRLSDARILVDTTKSVRIY